MKRIMISTLAIIFILITTACSGAPSDMSPEIYDMGLSALKAVDDYIDNKIDYDTASDKLDGLHSSMVYVTENSERDEYGLLIYPENLSAQTLTLSIKIHLSGEHSGHSTYNELLEARNELAQLLGERKRK